MKKVISAILMFIACSITQLAVASSTVGLVTGVYSDLNIGNGNIAFVKMNPAPTNKPACSNNPNQDYAFDSSTTAGKNLYAALLVAYAAQKQITIAGDNTCSLAAAYRVYAENMRWVYNQ